MKVFSLPLENGKVWHGRSFETKGAKKNLLILTGMQEHADRYAPFAKFLNSKGLNVYVLDAMGQGLNAVDVDHQQIVKKGDFEDNILAAHLKVTELKESGLETMIMGHSMGSFMTQYYLERFPGEVSKAILCGSNGGQAGLMGLSKFIASIVVNDKNWDKPSKFFYSLALAPYSKAIKNRKSDLDWLSVNEENVATYAADPWCGVMNSNGFWKEFLTGMAKIWDKKYTSLVSKDLRVLLIAGQDDPVGQMGKGIIALEKQYKGLGLKEVVTHIYPNMRHEILNEDDKEIVYNDVLSFIEAE